MSEQIDNSGPAFPVHPKAHECGDREYAALRGMTLRDYFAAKAMQSLIVVLSEVTMRGGNETFSPDECASLAYAYASAAIAARGDA